MSETVAIFAALDSVGTVVLDEQRPTTIVMPVPSTAAAILANATPVILPDNATGSIVIPDSSPSVVVLDNGEPEPPEPPQPIILSPSATTVILNQDDSFVILTSDAPGMPGPPGAPGESATLTRIAAAPLSGHRVVRAVAGGRVDYASSDELADATLVEGITSHAAAMGDEIALQASGEMVEPSWNWTTLGPIYCGMNGQLTQTPPTSRWLRQVATAIDTNRIIIEFQPVIILA